MESRRTTGGEYDSGGPRWYVFSTYIDVWRCFQYKDSGTGELGGLRVLLRDTFQHTSSFVKRFVYGLSRNVSLCMNVSIQTEILLLWLKKTCYFRLDRVWNIHLETTENSISRFLDFNIFWGSNLPQETPRGSRLWRSQYFPLLRNIRISTNTPSQTPATRLDVFWLQPPDFISCFLSCLNQIISVRFQ